MEVQEWLGKDNELGIDIWNKKYRYNNESFEEWLERVSGGNAELKQIIFEKKFLFGGRTLSNRGTDKKGSYSNCYSVGAVGDDLDDILNTNTNIAKTFKAQGGQGLSLSMLRPKGAPINGGQFESDGIIPFMEIFNRTTESISQGGSRKGALIMSLSCWHKEAEDFIKIKSEEGRIQKANLSIEIDDSFMEIVEKYYETGEEISIEITQEYGGMPITYEVTPIKLYKLMMEKAYDWAEPGCIFVNNFKNYNLMENMDNYQIEGCNPCGEQPLPKHGACNLGSINLSEFVKNPFTEEAYFDEDDFEQTVAIAIEALDVVLDENLNNHPLIEQRQMAEIYRNVGLGIMGLHDCLIKMGLRYGDFSSKQFIDYVMNLMFRAAVRESGRLARIKGAFPGCNENILTSRILKNHFTESEIKEEFSEHLLRNCSLLSIAPSGSIGTMLNVSTGCEPLYDLTYIRKTEGLNGNKDTYYKVDVEIVSQYKKTTGNVEVPKKIFNVASEIDWKDRVDIQSILQFHVDTAISSTVNLKNDVPLEEVEQLYLFAWKKNLKGITIYREGCKREGIITKEKPNKDNGSKKQKSLKPGLARGYVVPSNDNVIGLKKTLKTGCGTLHCKVFFDADTNDLAEIYLSKGSTGGCNNFMVGLSRMISMSARAGVSVVDIVDQLMSAGTCPSYYVRKKTKKDTSKGSSCPVAVGYAIKELWEEFQGKELKPKEAEVEEEKIQEEVNEKPTCPQCGAPIIFEGGCNTCRSCGWSKCE